MNLENRKAEISSNPMVSKLMRNHPNLLPEELKSVSAYLLSCFACLAVASHPLHPVFQINNIFSWFPTSQIP